MMSVLFALASAALSNIASEERFPGASMNNGSPDLVMYGSKFPPGP